MTKSLMRIAVVMAAVWSASAAFAANSKPALVPLTVTLRFPAAGKTAPVAVKRTDGSTAYLLSLVPDLDAGCHAVLIELVLRRPGDKPAAPNLLSPRGNWHGYRMHLFGAFDYAHGVDASIFGATRVIDSERAPVEVTATVVKLRIDTFSNVPEADCEFKELELKVEVRPGG